MSNKKAVVQRVLDTVRAEKRSSLTASESKLICDATDSVPSEGLATSAKKAAELAKDLGFPRRSEDCIAR